MAAWRRPWEARLRPGDPAGRSRLRGFRQRCSGGATRYVLGRQLLNLIDGQGATESGVELSARFPDLPRRVAVGFGKVRATDPEISQPFVLQSTMIAAGPGKAVHLDPCPVLADIAEDRLRH